MKCTECEHAKPLNRKRQGVGASAGIRFSEVVLLCEHPEIKHTVQSLGFTGKTSPHNCPLKKTK